MLSCDRATVSEILAGRRVAIVGSGPTVLENEAGLIDSHDVVVRINNYKLSAPTGSRTDVFYSFFGSSIKKSATDLRADGVRLCMCKCPDAQFMESRWHLKRRKMNGVDFRYIYRTRAAFWFCPTYIPTTAEFLRWFELLGGHIPTTGFAALLDVLTYGPAEVYLTGFDFFASKLHNVNERWRAGDPTDPIGHRPELERDWLMACDDPAIRLDAALSKTRRRMAA
jgi:hypothetical protein